jgi:hypothetical protein
MAFPTYVTVLVDGYGEAHAPTSIRTEMARGMPKQRKTQSDVLISIPMTLLFTTAAYAASFEEWYYVTQKAETSFWDWTDPRTGTVRSARAVSESLGPLVPEGDGTFVWTKRTLTIEYLRSL